MKRLLLLLGWMGITWVQADSQVSYLERPDLLEKSGICLDHTYAFSFREARSIQSDLEAATPTHPAPLFLEALIIYWENFPLDTGDKASGDFVDRLDRVIELSVSLMENPRTYTEGVFFDLFGRAFKAMYWADNGKTGKVVPDLGNMYRYTKLGFDLKDEFVEFYFSTGLYNYYIEAYPEAHPAYKPLVAFMQKGNRELGLSQLHHAIANTVFLKVESILFMSLIQLKYENDIHSAATYAERLVNDYPANTYYQGHLITILLHQQRFTQVEKQLRAMKQQADPYSDMIRTFATGFMAESERGGDGRATSAYRETIGMAESFGPIADVFQAMSYMGLSRLYLKKGMQSESGSYARKAARLTSYDFILDYQPPRSR